MASTSSADPIIFLVRMDAPGDKPESAGFTDLEAAQAFLKMRGKPGRIVRVDGDKETPADTIAVKEKKRLKDLIAGFFGEFERSTLLQLTPVSKGLQTVLKSLETFADEEGPGLVADPIVAAAITDKLLRYRRTAQEQAEVWLVSISQRKQYQKSGATFAETSEQTIESFLNSKAWTAVAGGILDIIQDI